VTTGSINGLITGNIEGVYSLSSTQEFTVNKKGGQEHPFTDEEPERPKFPIANIIPPGVTLPLGEATTATLKGAVATTIAGSALAPKIRLVNGHGGKVCKILQGKLCEVDVINNSGPNGPEIEMTSGRIWPLSGPGQREFGFAPGGNCRRGRIKPGEVLRICVLTYNGNEGAVAGENRALLEMTGVEVGGTAETNPEWVKLENK
jgi:hypothetical protein